MFDNRDPHYIGHLSLGVNPALAERVLGRLLDMLGLEDRFDQLPGLRVHFVLERTGHGVGLLRRPNHPGFAWF